MPDITGLASPKDATPAEIDAVWFVASGRLNEIADYIRHYIEQANDDKWQSKSSDGGAAQRAYYLREAERYRESHADEVAKLNAIVGPLEAEWARRGGWSRFTYCLSYGGHYHRGAECHTIRGSMLTWVADLSGLTDNEVIERVGYRACSQDECFSSAPLHPAWAISEERDKAAKVADREAKYQKGLALREKKVANIEKRLAKARARLESKDEYERSSAKYDIESNERDLVWAKREVERWLAKRK